MVHFPLPRGRATSALSVRDAAILDAKAARDASQFFGTDEDGLGTAGTVDFAELNPNQAVIAYARTRGISEATLRSMASVIGASIEYFRDLDRQCKCIVFKYPKGQWQARAIPDHAFTAIPHWEQAIWNLDQVVEAGVPSTIYVTEGQFDALSLVEAGIPPYQVIAIPGAQKSPEFIQKAKTYLDEAGNRELKFVWCGDNDEPGQALRDVFIHVVGEARCKYVEWPEGCKDANDVLVKDPELLSRIILHEVKDWPCQDIYRLSELPEPTPLQTWWVPILGERIKLAPRTLSVVTGQPGHGKTMFFTQVWAQIMLAHPDVRACIASFETRPKPHLRRALRTIYHNGRLDRDLLPAEVEEADGWIEEHYLFLVHNEERPSLKWLLEKASVAVVRHGVKIVQIDPWNRLEQGDRRPRETETEYIGRCLRELHIFAHEMGCHVQVIAHPAKMGSERRGGVPDLEDISASKHWENMVDQGFTIHRPRLYGEDGYTRAYEAELYHRKARFEDLGYPCKIPLVYNDSTKLYEEAGRPPPPRGASEDQPF